MEPSPPPRVSALIGWTVRSATTVIRAPRQEAVKQVHAVTDRVLGFVERTVLARIVADMLPHVIAAVTPEVLDSVLPRLIDAALPRIRTTVIPAIIGDLATDSRISALIAQQSRGTIAAFGDDLRDAASTADDRVDAAFRRRFRRAAVR